MTGTAALAAHIAARLEAADRSDAPWRHWRLSDVLPEEEARGIVALPFDPAPIGETGGKRETHNALRLFFSAGNRAAHPVCDRVAAAFGSPEVTETLQRLCGLDLAGSYLRIEYCQDTGGFWLEPHTDIGAKLFTMLVYLSEGPDAESWGTDIYDTEKRHLGAVPSPFDSGLIFIPGADTWHGFRQRPIEGVRRSIIINFVKPEWRSRHELATPGTPIA